MSEHVTKIVLLGDSNTGKTCIAYRFVQGNNIPNNVESTIGACFFTATVDFPQLSTEVHLWDTAGNIVYRTLVPMYLRNSNILIFVFDVTNISTFQSIPGFLRTCQPSIDPNCPPLFVLVGNKCDANPNDRQVSYEEGLEMAGTLGAEYYEVSALDGYGIIDLFTFSCYQDLVNQGISVTRPIQRDVQPRPQTQTQTQPRETTTTVTSNQPPQEPQPSDQLPLEPPQPTAEPPPEIVPAQTQQFLDSGPSLRNARALQCALIYTNSKSKNKISYINGPQITPISCTCSASHFIVLDTHHICYGFGNNRNHQIDPILPTTIPQFTKITIPDNCTVREVCTCKTFTAFILNDGRLLIHGNANEVENKSIFSGYKSPRGLSSYGNMIIFAHKTGSIICWNDKVRTKRKIEGYNVIDTKLNSQSMIALTGDGKVFICKLQKHAQFIPINFSFPILSIFSSTERFHFSTFNHQIYSLKDDNEYELLLLPYDSQTINIEQSNEILIRLDDNGTINYLNSNNNLPKIDFSISCFHILPNFIILFNGKPFTPKCTPSKAYHCCSSNSLIITNRNNEKEQQILYAFDSHYGYFDNGYKSNVYVENLFSTSDVLITTKDKNKTICITRNNRILCTDSNLYESFSYNLIKGDKVKTPSGIIAEFIGFSEGHIWLRPTNSKYVYSFNDPKTLYVLERPGHKLFETIVDSVTSVIDITPTFCESFGHSIDDLIFYPKKGIVKFVGMYSNRYVFMDFSDNLLFSSEIIHYELLRTFSKNIKYKRNIITSKGKVVELDIYGKNKIFLPGDRISSKFGDGIFLGTDSNGDSYIQTDLMRLNDIGGKKCNVSDLKLIRRIGVETYKKIKLNDDKVINVSISTNSIGSKFKAADIIGINEIKAKVLGVTNEGIAYAMDLSNDEIFQVDEKKSELLYRPDILSGESNKLVEVGSPAYEISALCPDDVVLINDENEKFVFKGIGRTGPIFMSLDTGVQLTTSFSALVLQDSFKVIKRNVIK